MTTLTTLTIILIVVVFLLFFFHLRQKPKRQWGEKKRKKLSSSSSFSPGTSCSDFCSSTLVVSSLNKEISLRKAHFYHPLVIFTYVTTHIPSPRLDFSWIASCCLGGDLALACESEILWLKPEEIVPFPPTCECLHFEPVLPSFSPVLYLPPHVDINTERQSWHLCSSQKPIEGERSEGFVTLMDPFIVSSHNYSLNYFQLEFTFFPVVFAHNFFSKYIY